MWPKQNTRKTWNIVDLFKYIFNREHYDCMRSYVDNISMYIRITVL